MLMTHPAIPGAQVVLSELQHVQEVAREDPVTGFRLLETLDIFLDEDNDLFAGKLMQAPSWEPSFQAWGRQGSACTGGAQGRAALVGVRSG